MKTMQGWLGKFCPKLHRPKTAKQNLLGDPVWRYSEILLHIVVQEENSQCGSELSTGQVPGPIPRFSSLLGQQPGPNVHGGHAPLRSDISQASCTFLPWAGSLSWHPGLYKVSLCFKNPPEGVKRNPC